MTVLCSPMSYVPMNVYENVWPPQPAPPPNNCKLPGSGCCHGSAPCVYYVRFHVSGGCDPKTIMQIQTDTTGMRSATINDLP